MKSLAVLVVLAVAFAVYWAVQKWRRSHDSDDASDVNSPGLMGGGSSRTPTKKK